MMNWSAVFLTIIVLYGSIEYSNAISPSSCMLNAIAYSPNATSCSDERDSSSCRAIFGPEPATDPKRPPNCVNPDLEEFALECANTCKLCCETAAYSCGDDPVSPINCTANTRYCRDPSWTTVMTQYCPGTCGLCTSASATCRDVITGCLNMRPLCNDVTFNAYMRANCQRTCLFCSTSTVTTSSPSTSTCLDVATNCATNSGLCNNSAYLSLMTTKCPRTCNRCSSVNPTCVNSNANCVNYVANGFCTSTFYSTAQKRQYCARSCNLC
uniref:ShKT domain-containing protein n=1 Tax=Panagrolaimus sp. ES5 TaxID=591445 RepID=A0AC34GVE9_9BILA